MSVPTAPDRPSVLGKLQGAQPAREVQQRVVRGALARVRRRARRPRLLWLLPVAAAASAAALAWVAWWQPAGRSPLSPRAERVAQVRRAAPVAPTPQLWQAQDDAQEARLGPHRLRLAPRSRLRALTADPTRAALQLEQGRVEFAVRPLLAGQSFGVRTPHLGVRVVGTRFSVEVDGWCSRVEVSQGAVAVAPADAAAEPVRLAAGQGRTHCAPPRPETLSAGEALVRDALAAPADPDGARRALALLGRYLRREPDGALAEEALYHTVLLQRRLGDELAVQQAARRFLARFGHTHRAARLRAQLAREKNTAE